MFTYDDISEEIFREYDIRGIYKKDLTLDVAFIIGKAFGTLLVQKYGKKNVVVGFDNRPSSLMLTNSLMQGIIDTGVDIAFLREATTPILNYACKILNIEPRIMVTASHNPIEYNGFKISFGTKEYISGEQIQEFKEFIKKGQFIGLLSKYLGKIETKNINEDYANIIVSKFDFKKKLFERRKKVVVDCGNGTTVKVVNNIFGKLNLDVKYITPKNDPEYPADKLLDPSKSDNLKILQDKVVSFKADIGMAFDSDGDRVAIVDNNGNIVPSDYCIAIIAKEILKSNENKENKNIVFDINCSNTLVDEIKKAGGNPIVCRKGSTYINECIKANNAIFAGEISGHMYFRDDDYNFDDGIYSGLRLLDIISKNDTKLSDEVRKLDKYFDTDIIEINVSDTKKDEIIEKVDQYVTQKGYNVSRIDGIKVNYNYGFAIIRKSNTMPKINLRFEATTEERLNEIKSEYLHLVDRLIKQSNN